MLKLEFLDHVGISVQDPIASAQWYEKVLGLSRVQPEEWKPVPIMMLAGQSGIALFSSIDRPVDNKSKAAFHFAFRVAKGELTLMKKTLDKNLVPYTEKDHIYFKSIYFNDPDGYRVEVTMRVLDF